MGMEEEALLTKLAASLEKLADALLDIHVRLTSLEEVAQRQHEALHHMIDGIEVLGQHLYP